MSARDCIHGHLARACNVCELDKMTVRANLLEAEIGRLKQVIIGPRWKPVPLFSCMECAEEYSKPADELAVWKDGLLCEECSYELDDVVDFDSLDPFVPPYDAEIERLRRKLDAVRAMVVKLDVFPFASPTREYARAILAKIDAEEDRDE